MKKIACGNPCECSALDQDVILLTLIAFPTSSQWRCDLSLLDEHERECYGKFHFARDRQTYLYSHYALRSILGHHLDIPPGDIRFSIDGNGKPHLADTHATDVVFNLSHTRGYAAVALAHGGTVGVDVEYANTDFPGLDIAKHFFAPSEYEALAATPDACRTDLFFRTWTLKEAVIKAVGTGLSMPLDSFAFRFSEDGQRMTDFIPPPGATERWHFRSESPDSSVRLALARPLAPDQAGPAVTLRSWRLGEA